jgi:hypothetical protein
MQLDKIDHLVLTVKDIEVSCDFYASARSEIRTKI